MISILYPQFFLTKNTNLRYNLHMSEKVSLARKAYWASMDPAKRSQRMRAIATSRQKKMSFKQKRDHALKMVLARRAKKPVV